MIRGNDASEATVPNDAFPHRLSGAVNLAVFVKLIASSLMAIRDFSVNVMNLCSPTSRLYWCGNLQFDVLDTLPGVKPGALVKAAGRPPTPSLNQ